MKVYRKYRRKHREKPITVVQNYYKCFGKKSENQINNKKSENSNMNLPSFWKSVWLIIINKEPKTGNKTANVLAVVMSYIFNWIAVIAFLLALLFLYVAIFVLKWNVEVDQIIANIVVGLFLIFGALTISLVFRGIANEIKAEKDRNYIATLFFGFTSLASLIVALIALFKGVG